MQRGGYELWFPLLNFANEKLKMNPTIGRIYGAQSLNIVEVKDIANALWGDVRLIDEYLEKSILKNAVPSFPRNTAALLKGGKKGTWRFYT